MQIVHVNSRHVHMVVSPRSGIIGFTQYVRLGPRQDDIRLNSIVILQTNLRSIVLISAHSRCRFHCRPVKGQTGVGLYLTGRHK